MFICFLLSFSERSRYSWNFFSCWEKNFQVTCQKSQSFFWLRFTVMRWSYAFGCHIKNVWSSIFLRSPDSFSSWWPLRHWRHFASFLWYQKVNGKQRHFSLGILCSLTSEKIFFVCGETAKTKVKGIFPWKTIFSMLKLKSIWMLVILLVGAHTILLLKMRVRLSKFKLFQEKVPRPTFQVKSSKKTLCTLFSPLFADASKRVCQPLFLLHFVRILFISFGDISRYLGCKIGG